MTRPAPDDIIGEVDRLNEYVRELMEYARNDAVSLQRVDPLDVVCGTLTRQRAALERARVEVTIDDKRRVHRPVEVDPPMLGQAMASIVTNAIEASPRGGRLHIALSDPDGRHTEISFADSGRGIPAAVACARLGAVLHDEGARIGAWARTRPADCRAVQWITRYPQPRAQWRRHADQPEVGPSVNGSIPIVEDEPLLSRAIW